MTLDQLTTSGWSQRFSLLLLRVTTGFLLVWVGLRKVVNGSVPFPLKRFVDLDGMWPKPWSDWSPVVARR